MISIILAVILGIFFTAVAFQNPGAVAVNFFSYTLTIPTYLLAAISFLAGLFISMIFHLVDLSSAAFNIHTRESQLRSVARANQELQAENNVLKSQLGQTRADLREEKVEHTKEGVKNFFQRLRHNVSPKY